MRIGPHSHPCQQCHVKTECCGTVEQNYDGWPEWVCMEFDMGNHHDFLCESCHDLLSTLDDRAEDESDTEGSPDKGTPNIL